MVHLILDTNIWLYIANNFISNYKGESHVKLFERLVLFQDMKYITIYVNDIILEEWDRNQSSQKEYVGKLRNKLKSHSELTALEEIIGNTQALKIVRKEFSDQIEALIKRNEQHIKSVGEFISKCKSIPIEVGHKLKTIDLAIHNKVPFHRNKNNINDALIVFSFDSYISSLPLTHSDVAYLVSHNKEEYCENKKDKDFHSGIKNELLSGIRYGDYVELWKILDLSEELQNELNKEVETWEEGNEEGNCYDSYVCPHCHWDEFGGGNMRNSMNLIFASEAISKIQLNLFIEEEYKYVMPHYTLRQSFWDICTICGNKYFVCPICYCHVNFEDNHCTECETDFSLRRNMMDYTLYIKDV